MYIMTVTVNKLLFLVTCTLGIIFWLHLIHALYILILSNPPSYNVAPCFSILLIDYWKSDYAAM